MGGKLRAIFKAIVLNPENTERIKSANKAIVEKRAVDSFFNGMDRLQSFRDKERKILRKEEEDKLDAVSEALEGFQEAQRDEELSEQGFHPDSTPTERMTMQAMSLLSHHLAPVLVSKIKVPDDQQKTPEKGTLEELASSPQLGLPSVPSREVKAEHAHPQKTESGIPADLDRVMIFLDQFGVTREQLSLFGIDPEKINPAKINPAWLLQGADLIKQLQD